MLLRTSIGRGSFVLILALAAWSSAAAEAAGQDGSPPLPGPPEAVAPASVSPGKSPAPETRPKLSPQITSAISSTVPVWSLLPADPAAELLPLPLDPEIVQMPRVVVWDSRPQRIDEMDWLTPKARDVELLKKYLTPFDRYFLNRLTLPIFGISQEARARMMFEEDNRLQHLKWMNEQIDEIRLLDPEEAKALLKIRNATFTPR
jgi:hypothetical protein